MSAKSYSCQLGQGRSLDATFLRMSDLVADSAAGPPPPGLGSVMAEGTLIETSASSVLETLLRQYSFAFETGILEVTLDGREDGGAATKTEVEGQATRYRTLGAWDDPNPDRLPFFPLPGELTRALRSPRDFDANGFLRFAAAQDFERLPAKIADYTRLWRQVSGQFGPFAGLPLADMQELGNLDLMRHIGAWKVDGLLPLFFSTLFEDGCGGTVHGGAHYVPPALHVDAMVCRNTGNVRLAVDDIFGARDPETELRPYSPSTPPDARAFGWRPFDLDPGESVVVIQRLLFSAFDRFDPATDRMRTFARAVYGPTHLPKGVIVDGESFPFDGRSHNAIIVASLVGKGSCPFLSSWCDRAQEWVRLGKVLTRFDRPDREGEECREFPDLRTRFKLVEREHERSVLRAASLEIETRDGALIRLSEPDRSAPGHPTLPWTLDIGQSVEFAFAPPLGLDPTHVVRSQLRLRGHYRNYLQPDLQRCAENAPA